jgi:toxin ParE1/3/4
VKLVLVHREARGELDDAMAFYERRARGLGLDLHAKVVDAVARIQRTPDAWPPHKRSGFRKCFTERFPFAVFYLELPDCIWIAAIAHGSRCPDYWRRRQLEQNT